MLQAVAHTNVNSFAAAVRASGLSSTSASESRRAGAYLSIPQLQAYLSEALQGLSVSGLALKTRSHFVRQHVYQALGYAPEGKTAGAMFGAQNADIYVQKASNLQIWNAKIDPGRRYLVVLIDANDKVAGVRAFTGRTLSKWNRTGTLTVKYQAALKLVFSDSVSTHVCGRDTERTIQFLGKVQRNSSANAEPLPGTVWSIVELGNKLAKLIGSTIPYVSAVDEKKRSTALTLAVGKALGYSDAGDSGVFPKLPAQMLEVKLQTSPTIDLGRTWPSSDSPLNFQNGRARMLRRRDVRFAVFYGTRVGDDIRLDKVVITPGARFWDVFATLEGKVRNTKLQIQLPEQVMAL